MTEHQTAAERARERTLAKGRERAAAYYAKHHDEVLERRRSRYAHDTAHREHVKRYQREAAWAHMMKHPDEFTAQGFDALPDELVEPLTSEERKTLHEGFHLLMRQRRKGRKA